MTDLERLVLQAMRELGRPRRAEVRQRGGVLPEPIARTDAIVQHVQRAYRLANQRRVAAGVAPMPRPGKGKLLDTLIVLRDSGIIEQRKASAGARAWCLHPRGRALVGE